MSILPAATTDALPAGTAFAARPLWAVSASWEALPLHLCDVVSSCQFAAAASAVVLTPQQCCSFLRTALPRRWEPAGLCVRAAVRIFMPDMQLDTLSHRGTSPGAQGSQCHAGLLMMGRGWRTGCRLLIWPGQAGVQLSAGQRCHITDQGVPPDPLV